MNVWTNPITVGGLAVAGLATAVGTMGATNSERTGTPVSKTLLTTGALASIGVMIAGGGVAMLSTTKAQFVAGHLGFYGGAVAAIGLGAAMLAVD